MVCMLVHWLKARTVPDDMQKAMATVKKAMTTVKKAMAAHAVVS